MSYTLRELAERFQLPLEGNGEHVITGVADLESATPHEISFLGNMNYESKMRESKAGCIVVSPDIPREKGNFLLAKDPTRAFQDLIELFLQNVPKVTYFEGIHPTAVIHPAAKVAPDAILAPYVVVDSGAEIGSKTYIGAHSTIGPKTIVGSNCIIHANVTIREDCTIGNRVVIQPGAVIGSCGFGFTTDAKGHHTKLNQIGRVTIEDDVEIGANTTIDRARFQTTVIGKGTKIDNLVQIGHQVKVGEHNLIVAQTGIAGSTETGRNVVLAGQVAVNGHIKLASGVIVTARSGVSKSLLKAGKYGGVPALPLQESNRISVYVNNLPALAQEIKEIRKELAELKTTRS